MQKQGNYYNSDLNEFIGTQLPREMTSIDADLFQLKFKRKIIRIGEYKHEKEGLGVQQEKALKQLAKMAKVIKDNPDLFDGWNLQVVLVRGNKPFTNISVTDFITGNTYDLKTKEQIQAFLCVEKI